MFESILTFLAEHKAVILGATLTITEALTIIINFYRRAKASKLTVTVKSSTTNEPWSSLIWWAINPVNLFRIVKL